MRRIRLMVALAFALLLGGTARATMMVPLDLRGLVGRADRIVLGTVQSSTAQWAPGHDAIFTEVKVRVSRSYKGTVPAGSDLVVRHEGGSVDGIGMKVFGAAQFTVGEEVMVFVEQRGAHSYVVGMAQGKLRVVTDSLGHKRVHANLAELGMVHPGPTALESGTQDLEEVERSIRNFVQPARSSH